MYSGRENNLMNNEIIIPTECPCCTYKLELVNAQLFCRNTSCTAQTQGKVQHFAKMLGIKGLGPKAVEKLNLQDVTELFYLDRADAITALGSEKIVDKLLTEIEGCKSAHLATVLSAFSIPLVGETASNKIAAVVDHISGINAETCKQAGLGSKVTANLLDWIDTEYNELKEFLPFTFSSKQKIAVNSGGDTICITGKLSSYKNKAEAHAALTAAGFTPVDSVTKTLKYLIDEEDKSSTKRTKAEQYGIQIITNLNSFLQERNT